MKEAKGLMLTCENLAEVLRSVIERHENYNWEDEWNETLTDENVENSETIVENPIKPNHYKLIVKNTELEVMDIIQAVAGKYYLDEELDTPTIGFYLGNVIKYLFRAPEKNGLQDLKKARYYLGEMIKETER